MQQLRNHRVYYQRWYWDKNGKDSSTLPGGISFNVNDLKLMEAGLKKQVKSRQETIKQLNETFRGVVNTISYIVEIIDPYTYGQQRRVVAVADVIEAMNSHRPYRPELGIGMAVKEIRKKRGILYNKKIADIAVNLVEKKIYF